MPQLVTGALAAKQHGWPAHKLPLCLQAAVTLREAALRDWAKTSRPDQQALRAYVLRHVLR